MAGADAAWPTEIKVAEAGRVLEIEFEDGARFVLPAEFLRVMSPSAEVQGHSRHQRQVLGGKREVAIIGAEPVGTYAVRLRFDDMHDTGLFTWAYLHELGCEQETRWAIYLAELEEAGLSRDRHGAATARS